ncbi:hypothetical protein SCHPADRAFT_472586 [Schizopora paradoxa]|uniref:Uncharacterized protein n=1 Tax=Schizopora paradoxa TaxID=27342 RepID=A0A0H2RPR5_9AGAM|nr:hypothetical protein SCHPADRAFT_472586 [Schizopora paradoxa]
MSTDMPLFLSLSWITSHRQKSKVPPPNPYRRDLLSMSYVHRTWTPIVLRILRKRVRVHDPRRLSLFLGMPTCGEWVVELWYIHDMTPAKKKKGAVQAKSIAVQSQRTHWHHLAALLTRLPNLRYLAVELVDRSEANFHPKESEGIIDPFDKASAQEGIEYRGVRDALAAIGKLKHLEGLVLLCSAFRVSRWGFDGSYRSSRYFPYFIHVCQQLPNLTKLRYLQIRGWGGYYDERHESDDPQESDSDGEEGGEKPKVDKEPLSENLVNKTPPPSLKTLVLEIPHYRCPLKHLTWLQLPKEDYKLQNLFVKFNKDCESIEAFMWACAWNDEVLSPLPSLESVRIEFPDPGFRPKKNPDPVRTEPGFLIRWESARVIMGRLAGVRTLHAPPFFLDAPLPSTLEYLRIIFEPTQSGSWGLRDSALTALIRDMKFQGPRLRIMVSITPDEEAEAEGFFKESDQDFIDERLENTLCYCEDNGIDFFTAEEKDVEGRIRDFLLLNQVH